MFLCIIVKVRVQAHWVSIVDQENRVRAVEIIPNEQLRTINPFLEKVIVEANIVGKKYRSIRKACFFSVCW